MKKLVNQRIEVVMGIVAAVAVVGVLAAYGGPNMAQAAGVFKDGARAAKAAVFGEKPAGYDHGKGLLVSERECGKDRHHGLTKNGSACPFMSGEAIHALDVKPGCEGGKDCDKKKGASGVQTDPSKALPAVEHAPEPDASSVLAELHLHPCNDPACPLHDIEARAAAGQEAGATCCVPANTQVAKAE